MTLKELHPIVPVVHVTAIRLSEMKELTKTGYYECPTYVTS